VSGQGYSKNVSINLLHDQQWIAISMKMVMM
jgi:hypothetical protein